MAYLVTAPELLAAVAADLGKIRSALTDVNANTAGPTTALVAAAKDEVSEAIAKLFGGYGQQYHALLSKAAAFHDEFATALATAGSTYANAEATNAALVEGPQAQQVVALIMGGTWNPLPGPVYLNNVNLSYILPHFPGAIPLAQLTPEQFWPVAGTGETFGTSIAQGVSLLNKGIAHQINDLGNNVVVFGYSQSATVATDEIRNLMAAGSPYQGHLSFVLAADPNNPNGGILERFTGFDIPFLNVHFNGATPPNSPYPTSIYTIQYDGIADAPQYPLNLVSDLNAFLGYFVLHSSYPFLTPDQVAGAVQLATSPGYTGNTTYYMVMTQNLPLIQFIRDIPYAGPPIADIFQPDLRVLVDLGYGDIGPGGGYANLPTPASLLSVPNLPVVAYDLAKGAVQGPWSAVVDIVVESGYTPATAWYPDSYPYLPSPDPHLHIYLGQPNTTGLSRALTGIGDIFSKIPVFS
ncbi:PE family protein [Mycobacterium conspicuum]|uniref:PE family protein PE4 n=1 Tax=Mycobacterium conspicuum TaxID=44010 RepID=A0A1X1TIH1_9MYCO|nr:PE-PPE domain-containing protein [Mycobacterium conspicuum]ORV44296.1 PE family protein [Mycobacterium conspicuum]BBZ42628.1 PE family protein PE4 [Mycobacterium conspicuum]